MGYQESHLFPTHIILQVSLSCTDFERVSKFFLKPTRVLGIRDPHNLAEMRLRYLQNRDRLSDGVNEFLENA